MFFLIVKGGILTYGKMKDIPVTRELIDFVKYSREARKRSRKSKRGESRAKKSVRRG